MHAYRSANRGKRGLELGVKRVGAGEDRCRGVDARDGDDLVRLPRAEASHARVSMQAQQDHPCLL
eukprot:1845171-Rhodomonas_salina.3